MLKDMSLKFGGKIPEGRGHRIEAQLTVAAQRPRLHILPCSAHQIQVFRLTLEVANALKNFQNVTHSHAARETLAAGLVLAKGDQSPRKVHHAGIFVGRDNAPGAKYRPGVAQDFEVQEDVHIVRAQHAPQRAARLQEFQLFTTANAAAASYSTSLRLMPRGTSIIPV